MTIPVAPVQGLNLGVTLYSFTNPFHARELSFEQLLARVAELKLGPGVEVIGFQSIRGFPEVSDAFAERFRELMAKYGLKPSALSVNADAAIRRGTMMSVEETVAYLEPQLRAAAKLGFPVVRSQFAAPPEAIRRLLPLIEKLEIRVGPEVHAPLGVNSPPVLAYREMYAKVNSPFLGFVISRRSTWRCRSGAVRANRPGSATSSIAAPPSARCRPRWPASCR
jgi:sugar phosphate isomerase/epimerase